MVHAQQLALREKLPLHVCVCLLVPQSELSTLRHYSFMLKGLEEVAKVFKSCFLNAPSTAVICIPAYDLFVYVHLHLYQPDLKQLINLET